MARSPSPALRQQVRARAGGKCEYCLLHQDVSIAKGGPDEAGDWALACRACKAPSGNNLPIAKSASYFLTSPNQHKSDVVDGVDPHRTLLDKPAVPPTSVDPLTNQRVALFHGLLLAHNLHPKIRHRLVARELDTK